MIAFSLSELAGVVNGRVHPSGDVQEDLTLDGPVVVDSRLATKGSTFLAMRGETTDGHDFASAAVAAGACAVIAERLLDVSVPVVVVQDSLEALTVLAREVVERVRAMGMLRVVAVTGSNGKTTTKNMLRAILERVGTVVAPRGSFNNHVGAPLSMLSINEGTEFLIVEMGASAVGDIARLVSIVVPDVSIVLKVGLAHAGGFGGIDETQRAKSEIVRQLPESAVAILNADDSRVASMAGMTAARTVTFGLSEGCDVRAVDVATGVNGSEFVLEVGGLQFCAKLRILGEHNVMNALAAIAATRELGVDPAVAVAVLGELPLAERWRMQLLKSPEGVTVINDAYNASPDSTAAALKTLAEITRGMHRSIAVLGEMTELGEFSDEEHDRLGRLAVRLNIDRLVVVGHGARHIHNAAGLEGSWDGESVLVADAELAYDLLRDELRSGDVVLVKSSNSAGLRFLGDRLAGVN